MSTNAIQEKSLVEVLERIADALEYLNGTLQNIVSNDDSIRVVLRERQS